MPLFNYSAIEQNSRKSIAGQIEALDLRHAKEQIRNLGHIPTEINEHREEITIAGLLSTVPVLGSLNNPGAKDLFIFTEQIHTLLDAGVPLIDGLFLLENQTTHQGMAEVIKDIRTHVITGDSFSNALARHPHIFSKLYLALIRAGETSGQLSEITHRLAALLDATLETQSKIRGAMMMPIITGIVISLVTILIVVFLVPQFEPLFKQAGNSLPLPTVLLMGFSHFMGDFWWLALIGAVGGAFWFNVFRMSPAGKPVIDQWLLKTPIIGNVVLKASTSSFIQTLATLQKSGVALTDSLVVAADTIDNYVLNAHLKHARESIIMGSSLSKPLEKTNSFPPMVVKMIAIGEETGSLDKMLGKASKLLNREVDEAIKLMTEMIQPAMTVVIGLILTFVLLGLYLPVFQMSQQF
jgi:type IV pilus assembly protein PilC